MLLRLLIANFIRQTEISVWFLLECLFVWNFIFKNKHVLLVCGRSDWYQGSV